MNDTKEDFSATVPESWQSPSSLLPTPRPKRKQRWIAWSILIACIVASAAWFGLRQINIPEPEEKMARKALAAAKAFVTDSRRSPSATTFPKTVLRHERDIENRLWVYLACDSPNGFAVMTREYLWVRVDQELGEWKGTAIATAFEAPNAPRFAPARILLTTGYLSESGAFVDRWTCKVVVLPLGKDEARRDIELQFIDDAGSIIKRDRVDDVNVRAGSAHTLTLNARLLREESEAVKKVNAEWLN